MGKEASASNLSSRVEQLRGTARRWTRLSSVYDIGVRVLSGPLWRRWQDTVLPHVRGRVLEVGCGTGLLLERLSSRGEAVGVDLSAGMLERASKRLSRRRRRAKLVLADAQRLPFEDASFDSAVSTFALTAVPDLDLALAEMTRVVRDGGTLVVVSVGDPDSSNPLTRMATAAWQAAGDIIRDEAATLRRLGLEPSRRDFGPFGSIHLVVAVKSESSTGRRPEPQKSA
jgi:ubiquinone/menaquinone biosynthesis C-methylase UbiE